MNYYDPVRVLHMPLKSPRQSVPGEVIYLDLWVEWATANPRDWAAIFRTNGPVRQRAASVAASFIVFMGCSCGRAFTESAAQLWSSRAFPFPEQAYLAAWAIENQRVMGVNSGLRTSEYMLATDYPIKHHFTHGVSRKSVPVITMEDQDIIESMVVWWSTDQAAAMRSLAVPMIEAANKEAVRKISAGSWESVA